MNPPPAHPACPHRDRADAPASPVAAPREPTSLRQTLSHETRSDHVALDASLSHFDLADPAGYRRFLRIHLAALAVLVDRCGAEDRHDVETWMTCLHLDLAIEAPRRSGPVAANDGDGLEEAGTAYVLRGSRLGAAFLLKRVGDDLPLRYLSSRPALSWPQFLARLASLDDRADAQGTARAVASARSAFAVFATAARVNGDTP